VAGSLQDQVIDQTYWLVHFRAGSLSASPLGSYHVTGIRASLALLAFAATAVAGRPWAQHRPPRFEDFPARVTFHGTPAPVDLDSDPGARSFQTVLRAWAGSGPNFAGAFTLATWGCGTQCKSLALVDARTGRVFFPNFDSDGLGFSYRLDSELLIVDPVEDWWKMERSYYPDSLPDEAWARYYRWVDSTLVFIDSVSAKRSRG
jgi:hypothetical protein